MYSKCSVLLLVLSLSFIASAAFTDLFTPNANVAIRWNHLHFDIIKAAGYPLSPPLTARALAVVNGVVYDTWSYFDNKAKPVLDYNIKWRGGGSNKAAKINTAVSVAAWRALKRVYEGLPNSAAVNAQADALLLSITGLTNPSSTDPTTPEGFANAIANVFLEFRDYDGANSLGNQDFTVPAATGNRRYQDYTNFAPVNRPYNVLVTRVPADCAAGGSLININKWEPLTTPQFNNGSGALTRPYATPFMDQVIPFALTSADQFRPRGPPVRGLTAPGRFTFEQQHTQVLSNSSVLDDAQKIIAEFWAPQPLAFGNPPNMFNLFAMNALIHTNADIEDSIKLQFAISNAVFDAGIAAWDAKRYFDSSRPITAIRCLFAGQNVQAWAGPYQGVKTIDGGSWKPYQEANFVTPPFSEYVSGHSTFSTAAATVLSNFFDSPNWLGPNSVTVNAGESAFEPRITDVNDPRYIAGVTDVSNTGFNTVGYSPRAPVTLSWSTWFQAAQEAGISRIYGGIHIQDGNVDGQALGSSVGQATWNRASDLFAGKKSKCLNDDDDD